MKVPADFSSSAMAEAQSQTYVFELSFLAVVAYIGEYSGYTLVCTNYVCYSQANDIYSFFRYIIPYTIHITSIPSCRGVVLREKLIGQEESREVVFEVLPPLPLTSCWAGLVRERSLH